MKIINNNSKEKVEFKKLKYGEIFKISDNEIRMKIMNYGGNNSVNMENGHAFMMDENAVVIPCDAELHIK